MWHFPSSEEHFRHGLNQCRLKVWTVIQSGGETFRFPSIGGWGGRGGLGICENYGSCRGQMG